MTDIVKWDFIYFSGWWGNSIVFLTKLLHLVNGFVYVKVYNNRTTIKTGNKQNRHFKWLSKLAVQRNDTPVCNTEAPCCLEQPKPFVSCILKSLCSRQVFKHFSPGTSTEKSSVVDAETLDPTHFVPEHSAGFTRLTQAKANITVHHKL